MKVRVETCYHTRFVRLMACGAKEEFYEMFPGPKCYFLTEDQQEDETTLETDLIRAS